MNDRWCRSQLTQLHEDLLHLLTFGVLHLSDHGILQSHVLASEVVVLVLRILTGNTFAE